MAQLIYFLSYHIIHIISLYILSFIYHKLWFCLITRNKSFALYMYINSVLIALNQRYISFIMEVDFCKTFTILLAMTATGFVTSNTLQMYSCIKCKWYEYLNMTKSLKFCTSSTCCTSLQDYHMYFNPFLYKYSC